MSFKVGDKVRRVDHTYFDTNNLPIVKSGEVYTVSGYDSGLLSLKECDHYGLFWNPTSFEIAYPALTMGGLAASLSYSEISKLFPPICSHVWKTYDSGFITKFDYCAKCDIKKEEA